MACSCGLEIERLLEDPAFKDYVSYYDWENPASTGIITCKECNTTVATDNEAKRYQAMYKARETQDLDRKAGEMASDLARREAAKPPGCQYCRDDSRALRRPDLNSNYFKLSGDYSSEGEALYVCNCGLTVGTENDIARRPSWVEYFFVT